MSDLRLDVASHDLLIENFNFSLTEDDDESVAQRLKIRLGFFLGEWFLNTNAGVPYFEKILKKHNESEKTANNVVDPIIRRVILLTGGVEAILSYESSFNRGDREYSIDFTVRSQTGEEIELTFSV